MENIEMEKREMLESELIEKNKICVKLEKIRDKVIDLYDSEVAIKIGNDINSSLNMMEHDINRVRKELKEVQ